MSYGYNGTDPLARAAYDLKAQNAPDCPLPPLLFMTDPERAPDAARILRLMPPGNAVIYRHFGRAGYHKEGETLRDAAQAAGHFFMVGADPDLAVKLGADGVHFAERLMLDISDWRAARPEWKITVAAHSSQALSAAASGGADAAILSPVFLSASPSAGDPLGVAAFNEMVKAAPLPVYALGGINRLNAKSLKDSGAAGIAAVSAIARMTSD